MSSFWNVTVVGVIEIVAGLVVAVAPRYGAPIVALEGKTGAKRFEDGAGRHGRFGK